MFTTFINKLTQESVKKKKTMSLNPHWVFAILKNNIPFKSLLMSSVYVL